MATARKRSTRVDVPRHRRFVGFVFVAIVLLMLSFVHFAVGYAAGRSETLQATASTLGDLEARWNGIKASGAIPQGPATTSRLTGVVSAINQTSFILDADPVRFELFGDEPRCRTVLLSSTVRFGDVATDGSILAPTQALRLGDRVMVWANANIRTATTFTSERIDRYARQTP